LTASNSCEGASASKANDVTFSMNEELGTEVAGAIANALRETAAQPQNNANQSDGSPPQGSTDPNRPASGVLLFVADLLSNSALSRLFGAERPADAMLRGSLVGLASGVDAVTKENIETKVRPLNAFVTVSAYVAGGIAVALLLRTLRRAGETATPSETTTP
jgi:hypothetical protein